MGKKDMIWYNVLQRWIVEIGGTILLIGLMIRVGLDIYNKSATFSPGIYTVFFAIIFLLIGLKNLAKILLKRSK